MSVRLISCGIFEKEIGSLPTEFLGLFEPIFLDSMLHMRPPILERRLGEILYEDPLRPTVVAFGDCCPHMREIGTSPGRARTKGVNCLEICMGAARFKELRREGAFFFMPEWLQRWKEVFSFELGFEDPELARAFMQESAKVLVYADTGCAEIPIAALEDIGRYFDLPVKVEKTGLVGLESSLRECMEELEHGRS
jgi:hypothetical protein